MAVVVKRTKEAGASTEKQKSTTADYKINPKDAHADGTCLLIFFLVICLLRLSITFNCVCFCVRTSSPLALCYHMSFRKWL
jgi:hypothetical protein